MQHENPLPSVTVIAEALVRAENMVIDCGVRKVSLRLLKAKRALFNARTAQNIATKQTTITEIFRRKKRSEKHLV